MAEQAIALRRRIVCKALGHALLNIRMADKAKAIRSIGQQAGQLAVMRQVAGHAITLSRGRMCSWAQRIMAALAESRHRLGQQALLFRGVRKVTGCAIALFKGRMDITVRPLELLDMAIQAKGILFGLEQTGNVGGVWAMAAITVARLNGCVGGAIAQPILGFIMAGGAEIESMLSHKILEA